MLTVAEVARRLGISKETVYRLINDGRLQAVVVSGKKLRRMRIEEQELERFIRDNRT